ncbi:general substrate transporter [Aspergillus heterothallicus]
MQMQGRAITWGITVACGSGFFLFGYDQGVFGGILNDKNFLKTFNNPDSTIQAQITSTYYLGAIFGAIFSRFIGDRIGRRKAIMLGSIFLTVGGALQASASTLAHMIIGRIVGGVGTGLNTTAIPMWQVETCKQHHRGRLVIMELVLNITGIAVTSWMNYGFTFLHNNSVSWRFPLAFQSFWAIVTFLLVLIMPESPRWLVLRGRHEEAQHILARMMSTTPEDPTVVNALNILDATVTHEREAESAATSNLLHYSRSQDRTQTLRRIALGAGLGFMQQLCGVNIIANYLPIVLTRSVGLSDRLALILSAVYSHALTMWATASILAIDSLGRKALLILGAAGQGVAFFLIAAGIKIGTYNMSIFSVVFIFVYNFFFGISFLSIPWLYPAEINSQAMRNLGTSVSTAVNWTFVYVIVLVTPLGIDNLGWRFYLMFGVFNLAFLPVLWYCYVETAGLSLEQIDRVFEVQFDARDNGMDLSKARKQVLLEAEVTGAGDGKGFVSSTLGIKAAEAEGSVHVENI